MYFVTWLYESISPSMTYRQQRQVLNRSKRQRMNESDPNQNFFVGIPSPRNPKVGTEFKLEELSEYILEVS